MKYIKTVGEYLDDFKKLVNPFRGRSRSPHKSRKYDAAADSRLLKDWPMTGETIDADLYRYLRPLRVRSRDLAKNNDYAKRFFSMLITNVIGPRGIMLQARTKTDNGDYDKADNAYLEEEWKTWGKLGTCTTDGKLSFKDCQDQFIKSVAMDGEAINRKITNWPHNKYRFAIQFLDPDLLDVEVNKALKNGNTVRLGIEFDKWRRPINYVFKKAQKMPTVYSESYEYHDQHEIIPAREIIHEYIMDQIGQSRGVPWMHTAARRLHMLGGYEEAELVAARTGAAKMGFFTSETGDSYQGADIGDGETAEPPAPPTMDAAPGTFEQLPDGMNFVKWDPDHPVGAYEAYVLAILRGVASGLNVSYVNLANDLRGVSYSSIRQGSIYEQDGWRTIQGWMAEHYLQRVWEPWLMNGLTLGAIKIPPRKYEKLNSVVWQGRGWQWVDPLKEGKANENAVRTLQKSPQQIAAEQGRDYEDILNEIKEARKSAENSGQSLYVFDTEWNKGAENVEKNSQNN